MTRPLNPQTARSSVAPNSVKAGEPATAGSIASIAAPLSHVAGRIVPIYNMRPTAHQSNEDSTTTVGAWSVPYYPTHGLWRDDDEDALNGAGAGSFIGPVFPQFGNAFALGITGHLQHPSAPTSRATVRPVPLDLSEEWDDLSTQAANADTAAAPMVVSTDPRADVGAMLDTHTIAGIYSDAGLYNLTCRDIVGADLAAAVAIGASAIQTGEADSEAFDESATIETTITIGDVGTVATRARLYIGSATAYGITSDDCDTASNAGTGYTVIPRTNTIDRGYGAPSPIAGQMLTQSIRDLIHLDRTCYGARGQVLLSHARTASTSHTEPTAALWSDDSTNWSTAVAGAFFRLPDVLPGSANVTGTSSSTTLALRGGLRCRVIAYNAEVKIGVRKATIAGTYGQSTTFGAWNIATATNATAAFVAMDCDDDATSVSGHVLLPSGIAPGDDYELAVWWRPSSADGYLRAWCVWEPALSTVSP